MYTYRTGIVRVAETSRVSASQHVIVKRVAPPYLHNIEECSLESGSHGPLGVGIRASCAHQLLLWSLLLRRVRGLNRLCTPNLPDNEHTGQSGSSGHWWAKLRDSLQTMELFARYVNVAFTPYVVMLPAQCHQKSETEETRRRHNQLPVVSVGLFIPNLRVYKNTFIPSK